jgi:hypothetical protein
MGIEAVMNIGGEQCVQKRRGKRDREVTKSPISITGDEEREEPKQADAAQQEGVISTEGGTFVSHVLCSTTSTRNSSHLQSLYYLPHCITAMHAHPSQQKQKRRRVGEKPRKTVQEQFKDRRQVPFSRRVKFFEVATRQQMKGCKSKVPPSRRMPQPSVMITSRRVLQTSVTISGQVSMSELLARIEFLKRNESKMNTELSLLQAQTSAVEHDISNTLVRIKSEESIESEMNTERSLVEQEMSDTFDSWTMVTQSCCDREQDLMQSIRSIQNDHRVHLIEAEEFDISWKQGARVLGASLAKKRAVEEKVAASLAQTKAARTLDRLAKEKENNKVRESEP